MNASNSSLQIDFSDSQKAALLTLLGDDDPGVYREVRSRIVAGGPQAVEWLKPHTLSTDPVLRRRAVDVIREFGRHAADNEFVVFCLNSGQDLDLEKGVLLLARTAYPDINMEAYTALLDDYARNLNDRLGDTRTAGETLKTMRSWLFEELGFTGNEEDYYDPQNSYFNRVMDRRTGNPISLCALYMMLGRRLRLPVTGIGLPGHFVCRYQTSSIEVYIDVFNRAKLMSKADCMQYLQRAKHAASEDHLAPVTTRRMLLRMCANLQHIAGAQGDTEESKRFHRYLIALSK